ncbi:MAG: YeeE/YedE family protein [Myxococcota bacterium]
MKPTSTALLCGVVFGLGLGLAGMTNPAKVLSFLDVTGDWDPSLAFVMAGAIAVYAPAYRLVTRRSAPHLGPRFHLPTRRDIDARLVVGALLFGAGWGLGGFCPGPALVSAAGLGRSALVFTVAMVFGMAVFSWGQHHGDAR